MNVNNGIEKLIGAVVVIFLVVAFAPEMFTELATLGVETPTWVISLLTTFVGVGLVMIVWKIIK